MIYLSPFAAAEAHQSFSRPLFFYPQDASLALNRKMLREIAQIFVDRITGLLITHTSLRLSLIYHPHPPFVRWPPFVLFPFPFTDEEMLRQIPRELRCVAYYIAELANKHLPDQTIPLVCCTLRFFFSTDYPCSYCIHVQPHKPRISENFLPYFSSSCLSFFPSTGGIFHHSSGDISCTGM